MRRIVIYTIKDTIPLNAKFLYAREKHIGNESAHATVVEFYYELPLSMEAQIEKIKQSYQ